MNCQTILEHSTRAVDVQYYLEESLKQVSQAWEFTWKTPPHDLARQLMDHIVEFKQIEFFI